MEPKLIGTLCLVLALLGSARAGPPLDVSIPGSLTVTLEPPEARAAGARWRIDGGAWRASGATASSLAPGRHSVEFLGLAAWEVPAVQSLLVIGDRTVSAAAVYVPIPSFAVGEVPPLVVWHGQTARFFVKAAPGLGAPSFVIAEPAPAGAVSFDPATGLFAYAPAAADRKSFTAVFKSASGAALQSVTIAPLLHLKPESEVLAYERPVPDPESRDYLTITETVGDTPEELNGGSRTTRIVSISGKSVVIDKDTEKNALHSSYDRKDDLKEMRIQAETVIVRSPFRLPQTDVTIHARELRFEDKEGTDEVGRIDTTPIALSLVPGELEDGRQGDRAGSISLHIERYHSDGRSLRRFILQGGEGQPAGPGKAGEAGSNLCPINVCGEDPNWPFGAVYAEHPNGTPFRGTRAWPGDGKGATPGGRPGNGGAGGDFRWTIPDPGMPMVVTERLGGGPGARAATALGGAPGTPNPARWIRSDGWSWYNLDETGRDSVPLRTDPSGLGTLRYWHTVKKGADAPGPAADLPQGGIGSISILAPSHTWLHPAALRSVLLHAKATYLHGNLAYVKDVTEQYLAVLDAMGAPAPEHEADFVELRQEMENLLHRVAANLDYFGNPAGWVPMLSFEANYLAFRNEIDSAIPILYLTYWLQNAAATAQQRIAAMEDAQDKLREELAQFASAYNQAQLLIPGLEVESANIAHRIAELEAALKAKEAALLELAERNVEEKHKVPRWKKALSAVGAILKVVPVAQPVLGAVGTGLDFVSRIKSGTPPLEIIEQGVELAKAFDGSQFKASAEQFKQKLAGVDCQLGGAAADYKKCFDSLKGVGTDLAARLKTVKGALEETQVPRSEVEAELARIKAEDPFFQEIVDETSELHLQKELFAERLAAATQAVTRLADGIAKGLLALDGLSRSISDASGKLDHAAFLYLKEMEQRTRDRLLKYQYYMAKAFEYRVLEPYQGTFSLNKLFDRFQDILDASGVHVLRSEQFEILKGVYTEELRRVAAAIFDRLNANAPERSVPIAFGLTDEELAQLNDPAQRRVTINLVEKGLFGVTEENLRIADLRTKDIAVHPVGGALGRTAILRLKFEHSGLSRLSSRGKTYRFTHYRTESVNPITWKTVYDGIRHNLSETQPSAASESLLKFLLELAGRPTTNLVLYSLPAAWADIVITKEVTTDNGIDMEIDSLDLEVAYDYLEKPSTHADLAIGVDGDLRPNIVVSLADANGRQDGRGDFQRVYPKGAAVTLETEPVYGAWRFKRWTDRFGRDLSPPATSPRLEVRLADHKAFRAVYEAIPDSGPGPRFLRGDANVSGKVDISDAVATLEFLFLGTRLVCKRAADANGSGAVDIADPSYTLNFLFQGGPSLPAPFPLCGVDAAPGGLPCDAYAACP
jgi:hypothetical protein